MLLLKLGYVKHFYFKYDWILWHNVNLNIYIDNTRLTLKGFSFVILDMINVAVLVISFLFDSTCLGIENLFIYIWFECWLKTLKSSFIILEDESEVV